MALGCKNVERKQKGGKTWISLSSSWVLVFSVGLVAFQLFLSIVGIKYLMGKAAEKKKYNLVEEYGNVLKEYSVPPDGNPTRTPQEAINKVYYFGRNGIPEELLYLLEASICIDFPAYSSRNFGLLLVVFNHHIWLPPTICMTGTR